MAIKPQTNHVPVPEMHSETSKHRVLVILETLGNSDILGDESKKCESIVSEENVLDVVGCCKICPPFVVTLSLINPPSAIWDL